ncbi:hypothetical protein ACFOY8_04065 [Thalassospira xianhensis]|nr:hypothetical protein [Thalassospira xianhensis]UKV16335.1 hypothetical protein L6172_08540 [Thalassospiraceae bacterium SW-3-3]
MRVIKILVAFMGVLIVAGVALVVYGLSRQEDGNIATDNAMPSAPVAGQVEVASGFDAKAVSQLKPFGTINIDLAPGETLVDFSRQGGEATLRLEGRHGSRLVIVSLRDGSILGQILLVEPQ